MPAITVARSPTVSTAARKSSSFSSSVSVGDSPVVPQTTSAVGAVVDEERRELAERSRVDRPSAWNGVTIAVMT